MEAIAWVLGLGLAAFLLFRFPKPFLITAGVIVAIATSIGGYFWYQYLVADAEKRRVTMTVSLDERCDAEHPLFITTLNRAQQRIEKVYFTVRAHRPGFSEPVITESYMSSDRIIEPDNGWGICWSISPSKTSGQDTKTLEWSAEVISVTFGS